MLVRPRDGEIHGHIPGDQPGRIRPCLQGGQDLRPGAGALPAAEQPVRRLSRPIPLRQVPPRSAHPVRHWIPSMSWRLVHVGGRPGFLPRGSNGSSTAHCASVRSARTLTGAVGTRSPVARSSWSLTYLPETSSRSRQRNARSPACDQPLLAETTPGSPPRLPPPRGNRSTLRPCRSWPSSWPGTPWSSTRSASIGAAAWTATPASGLSSRRRAARWRCRHPTRRSRCPSGGTTCGRARCPTAASGR